jgi:hypothetical protein
MSKSKIVETVERDGARIAIYDTGMERNLDTNAIIRPPTRALITKETALAMRQKRQEKTAALLRQRIREATEKVSTLPLSSSAAAVAEAGGILWDEIVLNAEAYPRDRLEAWLKLGQMAGIIPNAQERAEPEKTDPGSVGALADLVRELRLAIQQQPAPQPGLAGDVIDATATDANDTRNE